jgi:hypothetical protein
MRVLVLAAILAGCSSSGEPSDTDPFDAGADATADASSDAASPPPPADSELIVTDLGIITLPVGDNGTVLATAPEGALSLLVVVSGGGKHFLYVGRILDPEDELLYDWRSPSPYVRSHEGPDQLSLLVPISPEEGIRPGEYLFELWGDDTSAVDVRGTAIAKVGQERDLVVLDVVHHFVGIDEIVDASSAPGDPDFAVVLATYDAAMRRAGVVIGGVSFEDLEDPELASIDSFIGPDSEVARLFALAPDGRSLHIFWVEQISDPDQSYPIAGLAGGIPGPATLGGTPQSGVAVQAIDLHSVPTSVGLLAVHESLHLLGLFHTTEWCIEGSEGCAGVLHDPLSDTPSCETDADADGNGILTANECLGSDAANVMFWASSSDVPEISADQSWVVRHGPLTR